MQRITPAKVTLYVISKCRLREYALVKGPGMTQINVPFQGLPVDFRSDQKEEGSRSVSTDMEDRLTDKLFEGFLKFIPYQKS